MASPRINTPSENRATRSPQTKSKAISENITCEMAGLNGGKRMKQGSLLLLKGFDSIADTLSQLTRNLDNAIQGAKDLTKPPTVTKNLQSKFNNGGFDGYDSTEKENRQCQKNKLSVMESPKSEKLKNAKKLAHTMSKRAASFQRDLCYMRDRCAALEEENMRLRNGFYTGFEDDDLVRLQLEALLSEKSRLANDNANLSRENQCLKQILEYHQMVSKDISPIRAPLLDFSSTKTPRTLDVFGLSRSLDDWVST